MKAYFVQIASFFWRGSGVYNYQQDAGASCQLLHSRPGSSNVLVEKVIHYDMCLLLFILLESHSFYHPIYFWPLHQWLFSANLGLWFLLKVTTHWDVSQLNILGQLWDLESLWLTNKYDWTKEDRCAAIRISNIMEKDDNASASHSLPLLWTLSGKLMYLLISPQQRHRSPIDPWLVAAD